MSPQIRLTVIALCALVPLLLKPVPLHGDDPFSRLDAAIEERERDEQAEFEAFRETYDAEYQQYRRELLAEFERFKEIYREERTRIQRELGDVWEEPELSDQHVWVQYSDDATERRRVDFEQQRISISLAGRSAFDALELTRTLTALVSIRKSDAFQSDELAQAVERRSREELQHLVTDDVDDQPAVYAYLTGEDELDAERVEQIVEQMLEAKQVSTEVDSRGVEIVTIEVPLVSGLELQGPAEEMESPAAPSLQSLLPTRARSFHRYVSEYAPREEVDPALVYAIMEVESSFNPMATSHVPAYGLMQIVPESAGQDATEKLHGKPKILAPSYLYNSRNNIELGAAYFNILYYRYLRGITDPRSRLYCAVAAYNTGAGNVAYAFVGRRHIRPAVEKINRMTPEQVYAHLVEHLPYQETRDYMHKVFASLEKYQP